MAVFKAIKAVRANEALVEKIASLPYDVMNRAEAKEMAKGNEYSFLHVVRSEIDLDDTVDIHDKCVYEKAKQNLDQMVENKVLIQDDTPRYYIYRQIMWGRVQTGLVGCTSIDEYMNDVIKKHEFTRPEKEEDRINNFDYCNANTAPIFLTYRKNAEINTIINDWIKFHKPIYNFTSVDDITHIAWQIDDQKLVKRIEELFKKTDCFYIADGHHRSASSVKVGLKRRASNKNYSGDEAFNYFMSVLFPDEDLFIMDYNRVVKDLNGQTTEEYIEKVKEKFDIEVYQGKGQYQPNEKQTFGMYLDSKWYKLTVKKGTYDSADAVERLDASILQNNLLNPILGIENPRTDKRIDFVGGIRGLEELEKRVNQDMKVAFSMYPTTIEDLMGVADAGKVMPPKSTWFEPKLRSGLFVHSLD